MKSDKGVSIRKSSRKVLAHYLPWQKDLHLFDIEKRDVAPGKNLLRSMYNRAIECKVPAHLLRLDYTKLEQFGYGIQREVVSNANNDDNGDNVDVNIGNSVTCDSCHQKFSTQHQRDAHLCFGQA